MSRSSPRAASHEPPALSRARVRRREVKKLDGESDPEPGREGRDGRHGEAHGRLHRIARDEDGSLGETPAGCQWTRSETEPDICRTREIMSVSLRSSIANGPALAVPLCISR